MERMFENYNNNEPQSDDLYWNKRAGIFRIDTAYTNAAAGFISKKKLDFSYCDITVENPSAAVSLNSVTTEPLEDTDRILLTLVARSKYTGEAMDEETGHTIVNIGSDPMLVEPIKASVTIKTTENIKVYALDFSGQRRHQIATEQSAEGYRSFSVGAADQAVHYEITKGEM
jgi:hypothetical protein